MYPSSEENSVDTEKVKVAEFVSPNIELDVSILASKILLGAISIFKEPTVVSDGVPASISASLTFFLLFFLKPRHSLK